DAVGELDRAGPGTRGRVVARRGDQYDDDCGQAPDLHPGAGANVQRHGAPPYDSDSRCFPEDSGNVAPVTEQTTCHYTGAGSRGADRLRDETPRNETGRAGAK